MPRYLEIILKAGTLWTEIKLKTSFWCIKKNLENLYNIDMEKGIIEVFTYRNSQLKIAIIVNWKIPRIVNWKIGKIQIFSISKFNEVLYFRKSVSLLKHSFLLDNIFSVIKNLYKLERQDFFIFEKSTFSQDM